MYKIWRLMTKSMHKTPHQNANKLTHKHISHKIFDEAVAQRRKQLRAHEKAKLLD